MDNQTHTDEISLRELIESLFRGKYIIIGITVFAVVLSGLFSFFVLPRQYEAKTVLMANPINLDGASLRSDSSQLVEYLTKLPTMTIETYLQQILAPEVIKKAVEKLNLRDSEGNLLSLGGIRGSITVSRIKDTNLLEILVEREDAEQAAKIADAMAESFIDYITFNTQQMGQQAVTLIQEQLELEEANLNDKSQALADYWKDNQNIDVLKGSVSALKNQLITARERLLVLERSIEADKNSLAALVDAGGDSIDFDLDAFWITIGEDKPMSNPDLNVNLSGNQLSQALIQISINQIQTQLIEETSERAALIDQITSIETDLTEAQIQLTEDEYRFNALNRDMEMAKQAYDAYQQKYKEAMLTAASDIGRSSVIITSRATVPMGASSPNMKLNLAIGAVLGLMLGVFVALFVDYWKRSKPETAQKT